MAIRTVNGRTSGVLPMPCCHIRVAKFQGILSVVNFPQEFCGLIGNFAETFGNFVKFKIYHSHKMKMTKVL